MPHRRWLLRSAPLAAVALLTAALTACGSTDDPNPTGNSGTLTTTASRPATTTGANATGTQKTSPQVTDAAAVALCDAIRPELSNFRVQGPTLGRVGLNLIVHPWGLQHGIDVLGNKAVVDTVTTKSCPDVRQQTIEALSTPDLASVIVGL
ncbi:hypothetical protein [Nocardia bovistercoris]|uniref:Lipoprotein n=1 Tax=Nocardia bovistercoris TaxID=2785916 RepID=A0A931IEJ3_9NOCA|nr:hypothetical protein [Nocardia bovistercoris]MBH0779984.1 hypothetical protein [Nocardia bovistercoris]